MLKPDRHQRFKIKTSDRYDGICYLSDTPKTHWKYSSVCISKNKEAIAAKYLHDNKIYLDISWRNSY